MGICNTSLNGRRESYLCFGLRLIETRSALVDVDASNVCSPSRGTMATQYGKTAQSKVKKTMHERKHGTLKSGSGKKVTSRKQAIAIGLSEARKRGAKVPKKGH